VNIIIILSNVTCSLNDIAEKLLNMMLQEFSIFCNSSHLEWRAGLSDTILKGTHPGTIRAGFGLIW
jgi:hypothetical protein